MPRAFRRKQWRAARVAAIMGSMDPVATIVWIVSFVLVTVTVTGLSRRVGWSAPVVLVAVGAVVSFIPGVPQVQIQPELILYGLLPPLLFAAAIQTSFVDVRARRDGILLLSVGLVVFTVVVVGFATWLVVPTLTARGRVRLRGGGRADGHGRRDRDRRAPAPAQTSRHRARGREPAERRDRPGRAERDHRRHRQRRESARDRDRLRARRRRGRGCRSARRLRAGERSASSCARPCSTRRSG